MVQVKAIPLDDGPTPLRAAPQPGRLVDGEGVRGGAFLCGPPGGINLWRSRSPLAGQRHCRSSLGGGGGGRRRGNGGGSRWLLGWDPSVARVLSALGLGRVRQGLGPAWPSSRPPCTAAAAWHSVREVTRGPPPAPMGRMERRFESRKIPGRPFAATLRGLRSHGVYMDGGGGGVWSGPQRLVPWLRHTSRSCGQATMRDPSSP